MYSEKSCGAVIYRKIGGNLEFLCVSDRNDGHWGFPKGHVEKNENEEVTAIREVYEETGLQVNLINGFRVSVKYLINEKNKKKVIFFLAKVGNEVIHIQLDELMDYKWASFKIAKQLLSYETSKDVLNGALRFIKSSQ